MMKIRRKRRKTLFVGIDPGALNGWIAVMNSRRQVLMLKKLPNVKIHLLKKTKKGNQSVTYRTCEIQLAAFFQKLKETGHRIVVCSERIQPQGGIKAVGLAIAMDSAAVVRALCAAFNFSYEIVEPIVWQNHHYKTPRGVDPKEMSLQFARRNHPEWRKQLKTKNSDGKADAINMADFIRQKTLMCA